MNTKRFILIVDDDTDDREILRDAFQAHNKNGQEYVLIESGDALLNYLHQNNEELPALIMLDLNMPGKDGRETLKELKASEAYQQIPIVVFTTSSSQRDQQMSYKLGANCFITKPDTFNKLVELTNAITHLWLSQK